jgi:arylsulfatase A-like enzyme
MSRLTRLLVVLVLLAGAVWAVVERPWAQPPRTVVLISIDTLRPERLGVYGNAADVSPRIDALAQDAVVFDQALALSPWTLPSHMTMLTGLDPVAHGVRKLGGVLSERVTTLAEALKAAGFRTAAFTDGGLVHHSSGMGQGFEIYRDKRNPETMVNGFARLLPEALDWMRSTRHEDSFVFIHTFDVHSPYQEGDSAVIEQFHSRPALPGPDDYLLHRFGFQYWQVNQRISEYGRMSEMLRDYDAGVHEADTGVGQILDLLAETHRLDNALVLILSDHGESFGDHHIHVGHGLALTDDEIRIPLVVRFPGREGAGQRFDTLVDLSDVAPTALDVMGVTLPPEMQGESLLGLLHHRARRHDYAFGFSQNQESLFLVRDGFKWISAPALDPLEASKRHLAPMNPTGYAAEWGSDFEVEVGNNVVVPLRYDFERDPLALRDVLPDTAQLYDRKADPHELHNLYEDEEQAERVRAMASLAGEINARSLELHAELDDGQSQQPVDRHLQQLILQMGYAGASSPAAAQAAFGQLPLNIKTQLKIPWVPPDMTEVDAVDRDAHALRLAIAEHTIEPAAAQVRLQQLGNQYIAWLTRNGFPARIAWRIADLERLAKEAGVEVNVENWKAMLKATLPKVSELR